MAAATDKLYFHDSYLFKGEGKIVQVMPVEGSDPKKKEFAVILDATIFHPQGGGQPSDIGTISSADGACFSVKHVGMSKSLPGAVEHIGTFTAGETFAAGATVELSVDEATRRLHARLHSAGHLLDAAVRNIGRTDLEPSKGYHFPDGNAYVEYIGEVSADDRVALVDKINAEIARLLEADGDVQVVVEKKDDGNVLRTVNVAGVECPCGGTHVKKLKDIVSITVTRIKKNKKAVKVSYAIDGVASTAAD